MANKKTVVEMYTEIMNVPGLTEEQKAFLARRIELTEKKNAKGGNAKPTAQQVANEGIKAVIIGVLTNATEPMTINAMCKENAELAGLSNQRISALLTQLIDKGNGCVVRSEVKGKAHFAMRPAED